MKSEKLVSYDSEEGRAIRISPAYLDWVRTEWNVFTLLMGIVLFGGGVAGVLHYLGTDKSLVVVGCGAIILIWTEAFSFAFKKAQKKLFGLVK